MRIIMLIVALLVSPVLAASNEHLGDRHSMAMAQFLPSQYHIPAFCTALYSYGMQEIILMRWKQGMTFEEFKKIPGNRKGISREQILFIDALAKEAWEWELDPESWAVWEFNECLKPRPESQRI